MLDYIAHILIAPINQFALGILLRLAILKFTPIARWFGKSIVVISVIWGFLCSQYFF